MLFPKFSALQSRFAASFAASLVLVLLYLALSNPHLAYAAADADSIAHEDHNHPRLLELLHQPGLFDVSSAENELEGEDYTPEFAGLDRSIIGRADATIQTLDNNVPGKSNIDEGQTQYWTFPNKTLWGPFSPQTPGLPPGLSKRDAQSEQPSDIASDEETAGELLKRQTSPTNTRKVFLSINTCEQAHANDPNPNGAPPQLELYISQKSSNQKPDQNNNDGIVTVDGGYGEATLDATSDIWFTVSAPQSSNFGGSYNYELTASIDAPYASYNDSSNFGLNLVDTDINSALLYSSILVANKTDPQFQTQSDAWMNSPPRFSIYVHNQNDSAILGLHRSVCGLKNHAQIQGNMQEKTTSNVDTDMTKRGDGRPKQEFYVKNLNGSSAYYAIIGIDRNSTPSEGGVVGGGGTVWKVMNFTTKSGMYVMLSRAPLLNTFVQQMVTVKSSTTSPSALMLPMPCPLTQTSQTSPAFTKTSPKVLTQILVILSSKFPATLPPQLNTPLHEPAQTAIEPTNNGFAPSQSRGARISPPQRPGCNLALLPHLLSMELTALDQSSMPIIRIVYTRISLEAGLLIN